MIAVVGFNLDDITQNPICAALGTMKDGGWYECPYKLSGTIFGFYSTINYINFAEAMAYS